ncbi:MAG: glycosyltransferase [Planctomycetes bacterium]|nr:glycosyltransferase [Planctomycetota bacterium]
MPGIEFQVAACIVLHESATRLAPLLASLDAQSQPLSRLIFCLNGADDGAAAIVAGLGDRAVLLRRPDNPGFSAGINACLERADTSHVLILNPDVVLDPDYVARCLAVFGEEDRVGGVAGQLLRPTDTLGEEAVDSAGFVAQPWLRIVDRASGARATDRAFHERESVVGICAAAALFDRQALALAAEDGRVMDEDFWMYKEDQDLCLRLREIGMRLIFEPGARAHHERGWAPERSRRDVRLEVRRHSLKNRYLILMKHWRWREHIWALPFIAGFEIFLFLALALREPRTMKGYLLALELLPRMFEKRRVLMSRVRALDWELEASTAVLPVMPW